jgi:hypothetical protein
MEAVSRQKAELHPVPFFGHVGYVGQECIPHGVAEIIDKLHFLFCVQSHAPEKNHSDRDPGGRCLTSLAALFVSLTDVHHELGLNSEILKLNSAVSNLSPKHEVTIRQRNS